MKSTRLSTLLLLCVTCCAAFGQQTPEKLSFEVASIKPAEPMPMNQLRISMNADAGMLRYTNVSLLDCIHVAYRVKDFQIDGPDWLNKSRFDIVAKFPEGAKQEQVPEMLQALLADRFKLAVHRESKEHAVYALVAGKGGPKLKPAEIQTRDPNAPGDAPDKNSRRGDRIMMMMDGAGMHLKAPSASLSNIADVLSKFTERPVLNMTDIEGQYDFDLVFAPETMRGMPRGPRPMAGDGAGSEPPAEQGPSVFDAVQQYGLKLEPRKAPLDVLVIDHVEKTPTEN